SRPSSSIRRRGAGPSRPTPRLARAGDLHERAPGRVQVTALKEVVMTSTVEAATELRPFHVEIPEEQLDDLRRRVAATRWPSKELVTDRSQGVQLATLQELARY